jgi:predicted AAA+ superfamily ATPase
MITRDVEATLFDLESQQDLARLQNPELTLSALQGLVIIDEVQQMPALFNVLRVLVDREPDRRRFLILGSASPDIIKNVSESLAGRVEFIDLSGFNLLEVDMFFIYRGKRFGIEIKYSESPKITRSARIAMRNLNLKHMWFIYPGSHSYPVEDNISVLPLSAIAELGEHINHLAE